MAGLEGCEKPRTYTHTHTHTHTHTDSIHDFLARGDLLYRLRFPDPTIQYILDIKRQRVKLKPSNDLTPTEKSS